MCDHKDAYIEELRITIYNCGKSVVFLKKFKQLVIPAKEAATCLKAASRLMRDMPEGARFEAAAFELRRVLREVEDK